MLLWSRAVAPRLDPYTTVHLDRLTAEGFAELGVQFGHDDLGSLEGSMFYRLSEFTFVLMFLNFMKQFDNLKIDDFMNSSYVIILDLLLAPGPLHDPEGGCLGLHSLTSHRRP